MSISRRMKSVILAAFVVVAVFGIGTLPAWANQGTEDPSHYSFALYTNPYTWQHTDQRHKENTSNCYVKATSMSSGCSGIYFSVWSWTTSGLVCNNTVNSYAYMPSYLTNVNCHIRNNVIQNLWHGCGLVGAPQQGDGYVTVMGEWSPDSVGYGYVLN